MIPVQKVLVRYTVTAGVLEYAVPFALYGTGDVNVYWAAAGDRETQTRLAPGTDYSVTVFRDMTGGKVTLADGKVPAGATLAIESAVPLTQELDLSNTATVDTEATEGQLDRIVQMIQQFSEQAGRAVKVPVTSDKTPEQYMSEFWEAVKNVLAAIVEAGKNIGNSTYITATDSDTPRTLADRFGDVVNVKDFGAVGDGVTDDTEAIQAALNAAKSSKKMCFGEGTFLISETVQIDCSCNFSAATFNVHGAAVTPAIKVGQTETTHSTLVLGLQIFLPQVVNLDAPVSGFTGIENSIGIQVLNLFSAEVHVPDIKNFYRGLYLTASQTGNAWNTYYINTLTFNKFNLDISPIGSGWVNQNIFIGGRFRANENSESDKTTQIRLQKSSGSSNNWGPNNNVFVGCDLSDPYAEYAIDCNACYNYFYGCRYEYDSKVRFKANSEGDLVAFNQINGGLRAEGLVIEINNTVNGTVRNNEVIAPSKKIFDFFGANNFLALGRSAESGIYLRGYGVGTDTTQAKSTDTNWLVELSTQGLKTKAYATTAYPNVSISSSIKISSGDSEAGVEIKQLYNQNILFSGESLISVAPESTGTISLGSSARRWSQLFADTAVINTSDVRTKTSLSPASDVLLDAWGAVPIHTFQFTDAVEKKGTDFARLHVGVVAQDVQTAFAKQSLDAAQYGLFCHDEWEDEYEDVEVVDQEEELDTEGNVVKQRVTHIEKRLITPAGDHYGIRYEEALCLEAAYQRRRAQRLEESVSALETRIAALEASQRDSGVIPAGAAETAVYTPGVV